MLIIEEKGNRELLNRVKTLFLCSKMTPVRLYEYVFRWTDGLTDRDCIACFNSTEMESEVLKALLVGKVPTILFVMNRFTDVNNIQIEQALKENRLLIVVLRRDEPKGKGGTPRLRNEYVLSMCQQVVCGYVNKNGSVFPLLAGRSNVLYLIDERNCMKVAESDWCHEHWTVAQDKVLLRMYYADMGIHAIHNRLHRSYMSVYTRIRSITQPESLLKGREFEDFVLGLFNIQEGGRLVLQEWQGDKSLWNIQPENNSNPDFVFRYDDQEFAIECKWREKLDTDIGKDLFPKISINHYQKFSALRRMPVSMILGVGGEPCNPEVLYVIPLRKIDAVVSHTVSIVNFVCPIAPLDLSLFVRTQERVKERTYTLQEKRSKYPNAYKPWTQEEDERLQNLYRGGMTIDRLVAVFQRNVGAIRSRIKKVIEIENCATKNESLGEE